MMDIMIGDTIKRLRKEKHLTQAELGEKIGVSGAMIGHYETGVRNPKFGTVCRIATALGVPAAALLPRSPIISSNVLSMLYDNMKNIPVGNLPSSTLLYATIVAAEKENASEPPSGPDYDPENEVYFSPNLLLTILLSANRLNSDGRQKAAELLDLLQRVPEYQRKD